MRLDIEITLDSGGRVLLSGRDLSAEDVNEVFSLLAGYEISSEVEEVEEVGGIDLENVEVVEDPVTKDYADSNQQSFREGFAEGRG